MSDRDLRDAAYAAKRLGVSVSNIYRLVSTHQLAYVDINTGVVPKKAAKPVTRNRHVMRFLDEDLDAFIARRRIPAIPREEPRVPVAAPTRRSAAVLQLPGADRYA